MDIINPFLASKTNDIQDPNKVAEAIAVETEKHSLNPHHLSPFAKAAQEYSYEFMGGKADDITLAVAQVKLYTPNQQWRRNSDDDNKTNFDEEIFTSPLKINYLKAKIII